MPSPIRKTASRKALAAEVDQLHSLLKGVGYDLDHNYGHMVLMEHENKNMQALPRDQKQISEALKAEKRRQGRGSKRRAAKAAKAVTGCGGGGGARGGRRRGVRGSGAVRGVGRGRGKAQDSSDEEESGPEPDTSEDDSDIGERSASASPGPSATNIESSDEEADSDEPTEPASHGLTAPLEPQYVSDDDDKSDQEETGIISFNGHRWESRRNLQFQVVWRDGDVTWEPLFNVNDCTAMEGYLAHRDVDDPLRLSKRKFLIDKGLRASNE
ncbi:hypothetical protein B0H13DRAFT_2538028 [Mycena leptocephala]|nr:hypothetical protein B0H13DRAFT_2538028 [Mycena leptocephala]